MYSSPQPAPNDALTAGEPARLARLALVAVRHSLSAPGQTQLLDLLDLEPVRLVLLGSSIDGIGVVLRLRDCSYCVESSLLRSARRRVRPTLAEVALMLTIRMMGIERRLDRQSGQLAAWGTRVKRTL